MRRSFLLIALLTPTLALAQPGTSTSIPADDSRADCARARAAQRPCVLTIEAEEVPGGVVRPEGQVGTFRLFEDLASLFRPRRDFLREIVAAAHDAP